MLLARCLAGIIDAQSKLHSFKTSFSETKGIFKGQASVLGGLGVFLAEALGTRELGGLNSHFISYNKLYGLGVFVVSGAPKYV